MLETPAARSLSAGSIVEYEATIKAYWGSVFKRKLPEDPVAIRYHRTEPVAHFNRPGELLRAGTGNRSHSNGRAVLPRAKAKVVRKDAANLGKAEKKIHEILQKVQEVHDTDRPYTEVGLTEYEWNRYNRGTEKYPRHAEYRDRRNLAAYYADNLKYHAMGRMLPIRNLVNSMGVPFQRDARAYYRLRAAAGVVDGVKIRRSIRMTVPYKGKGAENGKPIGSFYVTGSIEEPSTHELVWYPEFEADFRPATTAKASKSVWFGEDQRGRP